MKAFSKEKFLSIEEYKKYYYKWILPMVGEDNWVNNLDGKTEKEIQDLGYSPVKEAMIEK